MQSDTWFVRLRAQLSLSSDPLVFGEGSLPQMWGGGRMGGRVHGFACKHGRGQRGLPSQMACRTGGQRQDFGATSRASEPMPLPTRLPLSQRFNFSPSQDRLEVGGQCTARPAPHGRANGFWAGGGARKAEKHLSFAAQQALSIGV